MSKYRTLRVIALRDIRTSQGVMAAHKGEELTMSIERRDTAIGIDIYYILSNGRVRVKTLDTSLFVVVGVIKDSS